MTITIRAGNAVFDHATYDPMVVVCYTASCLWALPEKKREKRGKGISNHSNNLQIMPQSLPSSAGDVISQLNSGTVEIESEDFKGGVLRMMVSEFG